MKKILVCGTGACFHDHVHHLRYHELLGHFEVIGITSNSTAYKSVRDYKFIPKQDINNVYFDFICVMAYDTVYNSIKNELLSLGISNEKIFSYRVLMHDNLDMDKYEQLKKYPPTIFSNQCFGGLLYHSLDLPFTSPFINMAVSSEDFFKFLASPRRYMDVSPEFSHMSPCKSSGGYYPVGRLDDLLLYFNHSRTYEEAISDWNRRKMRINWDNILVTFTTSTEADIKHFENIPYSKKICATTLDISKPHILHINSSYANLHDNSAFWSCVVSNINHPSSYFDALELLYSGTIQYHIEKQTGLLQ